MRTRLLAVALAVALAGVAAGVARGVRPTHPMSQLTYTDPTADSTTAPIDVSGMTMTWDKFTGGYTITLTADAAHPFTGQFRVNLNLYDPSAPSASSFFQRVCSKCNTFSPKRNVSDFDLGTNRETSLTFGGSNKVLESWSSGDQVAINTWAGLGDPPAGSPFRSSVAGLAASFFTDEDVIGIEDDTCFYAPTGFTCNPLPSPYGSATITAA
jgi:hypothetical protein